MSTYISILRWVNVSGKKKIKMADLRDHLKKPGFPKHKDLHTKWQSANLIDMEGLNI